MKRPTRLRPSQGGKFAPSVAAMAVSDPVTGAARHRCLVCNESVENDRRYAICPDCDDAHAIRSAWADDYGEREARHDADVDGECFCPGWLWMNEQDDASFNIERCDCCAMFRDDLEAANAMLARCSIRDVKWP